MRDQNIGTRFTVTEDHLKLLRRAYVSWEDCEYGAPAIDCKRPYGNSFVEGDIAEILGVEYDERGFTSEQEDQFAALHRETQTALQIILTTGRMEPGDYERPDTWSSDWKPTQEGERA